MMIRVLALAVLLAPTAALLAQGLTYEDRSGTITAGAPPVVVLPRQDGRHGCLIQTVGGQPREPETATAVAGPPSQPLILAGQQFLCMVPASGQAYSIIGATTAQAFVARQR